MVGKKAKAEFERDGVRAVREKVEQGSYWEGKNSRLLSGSQSNLSEKKQRH
jgi:hypothetical protein